ncbi:NAD(P)H-dependent oxidoreductase subunit E [Marivirga lumbricoides]
MQSDTLQKFIFICSAKSCSKNGSEEVKSALKAYIKSNGLKKEALIVKTKCMDFCKSGPNVVSNGQLYHKVSVKEAKEILRELLRD